MPRWDCSSHNITPYPPRITNIYRNIDQLGTEDVNINTRSEFEKHTCWFTVSFYAKKTNKQTDIHTTNKQKRLMVKLLLQRQHFLLILHSFQKYKGKLLLNFFSLRIMFVVFSFPPEKIALFYCVSLCLFHDSFWLLLTCLQSFRHQGTSQNVVRFLKYSSKCRAFFFFFLVKMILTSTDLHIKKLCRLLTSFKSTVCS